MEEGVQDRGRPYFSTLGLPMNHGTPSQGGEGLLSLLSVTALLRDPRTPRSSPEPTELAR